MTLVLVQSFQGTLLHRSFCEWLLCFNTIRVCYSLHTTQLENTVDEQKQSRHPKTNQSYAYAHKKFYVSEYLQSVLMRSILAKLWLCSGTAIIMMEKVTMRLEQYATSHLITA